MSTSRNSRLRRKSQAKVRAHRTLQQPCAPCLLVPLRTHERSGSVRRSVGRELELMPTAHGWEFSRLREAIALHDAALGMPSILGQRLHH